MDSSVLDLFSLEKTLEKSNVNRISVIDFIVKLTIAASNATESWHLLRTTIPGIGLRAILIWSSQEPWDMYWVTKWVVQSHILEVAEPGLEPIDCHSPEPRYFTLAPRLVSGLIVYGHTFWIPHTPPVWTLRPLHMLWLGCSPSLPLLCLVTSYFSLKTNSNITSPSGKIVTLSASAFHSLHLEPIRLCYSICLQVWSPSRLLVHSRWSPRLHHFV